jgi:hypothetical protein
MIDDPSGNPSHDREIRSALQGKLDALKFEFDNNLAPPAAVEVLHRATDELIASGAQSRALKAGDVAPECSYGIGFFLPCRGP